MLSALNDAGIYSALVLGAAHPGTSRRAHAGHRRWHERPGSLTLSGLGTVLIEERIIAAVPQPSAAYATGQRSDHNTVTVAGEHSAELGP